MITLYGISNCDTIKRTKAWLTAHNLDFQFHDYKKAGCPPDLARQFLQHFTFQELINRRGSTWRKLPETTKSTLNAANAIGLMNEQPSIIKRPLLQTEKGWILGFNEAQLMEMST